MPYRRRFYDGSAPALVLGKPPVRLGEFERQGRRLRRRGGVGDVRPHDIVLLISPRIFPLGREFREKGGTKLKFFRLAGLARVSDVEGGEVELERIPSDIANDTHVTVLRYARLRVIVEDLLITLRGDPTARRDHRQPAIWASAVADLRVNRVHGEGAASDFLRLTSCWRPQVSVTFDNLPNDPDHGRYGYGVNIEGATTGARIMVRGTTCRHGVTTNQHYVEDPSAIDRAQYVRCGRPFDNLVENSVVRQSGNAAFDTHEFAVRTQFVNCVAAQGVRKQLNGGATESTGFRSRGVDTTFSACLSVARDDGSRCDTAQAEDTLKGHLHGFLDAPQGLGSTTRIVGCRAHCALPIGQEGYGYGVLVKPVQTAGLRVADAPEEPLPAPGPHLPVIEECHFEHCGMGVGVKSGANIGDRRRILEQNEFTNCGYALSRDPPDNRDWSDGWDLA